MEYLVPDSYCSLLQASLGSLSQAPDSVGNYYFCNYIFNYIFLLFYQPYILNLLFLTTIQREYKLTLFLIQ